MENFFIKCKKEEVESMKHRLGPRWLTNRPLFYILLTIKIVNNNKDEDINMVITILLNIIEELGNFNQDICDALKSKLESSIGSYRKI